MLLQGRGRKGCRTSPSSPCVCVWGGGGGGGGGGAGAGERASLAKSTSDVNYSLKNAREGSKRRSV